MGFVMNFIKCNNFSFIIQIEDDSFVQDSGVSEDVISSKKRKVISDIDDDDSSVGSEKIVPQFIKPVKVDEQPLPDPFPLPRHFTSEVELALTSKKMTRETNALFLSAVASAMLSYKRFPTKEEYTRVAKDIISKYHFMKPQNGSPTVSILY